MSVQGLEFGVEGLDCGIESLGVRVQGQVLGFGVWSGILSFRDQRFEIQDSGFRVHGLFEKEDC